MASIQASADYTDRDLASLRARLRTLIASVFTSWTDTNAANFGNVLLDLVAWSSDLMGFAQDAQAAEAFLPTATQRRSLLKLAALVGYKPAGATAASTVETFSVASLAANCNIPAGTIVKTLDPEYGISFQTLSPITLSAPGPSSASVTVENSTNQSDGFDSTGQPNLSVQLGSTPYLDGSLSITTPGQGLFTEVPNFVNSGPSDQVFVVTVDDNDTATVTFGDGVTAGLIPIGTISAAYKTGGGASGNAAAGAIVALGAPLLDIHGGTCAVTCTNALAATGGADREGAEAIRANAPASITKRYVSVLASDFETHACEIDGIDRALYLTMNEDGSVPLNSGALFVLSPGATGSTLGQVDQVRRQFVGDDSDTPPYPLMVTQVLSVGVAPVVDVDVTARIYLKKSTVAATVKANVLASLVALFANEDFAYSLRRASNSSNGLLAVSDVEAAIHDADGVREIAPDPTGLTLAATRKIWDPTSSTFVTTYPSPPGGSTWTRAAARVDVVLDYSDGQGPPAGANFPRLGTVTLVDGDTGLTL